MIHSITRSCFPVFGKCKCTKYEVRSVSSGLDWHFRPFSDAVVVSEKKVRQIFGYVKKNA